MKTLFAALWLIPLATLGLADVAIYNGFQVNKTTSLAGTRTVTERFIEIVDLSTGEIVVISLNNAQKTFSVGPTTTVMKTEVQDSRGSKRAFTVLASASTTTDVGTGITTVSSFLQTGANLQVALKTGAKTGVPRNMHSSASVVSTAGTDVGGPIPSSLLDSKGTLVLQEVLSRTSNDAGDTLAAVVDRVKAFLISRGFEESV